MLFIGSDDEGHSMMVQDTSDPFQLPSD